MTTDQARVAMLIKGTRKGMTRAQLVDRTGMSDRAIRQTIEDLITSGNLAIVCDRGDTGREEGRYRLAGADEVERVNRELNELTSRGISALRRAKGLRIAYEHAYHGGSLFLADVPEVPA
jgi:predicted ArsR family transcriptional regulator